jgi:hypothetical protein
MSDIYQISDTSLSPSQSAAFGHWSSIAADVHQDPQFNKKLAD